MGTSYGPRITTNGLTSIFDVKNDDNIVSLPSNWKIRTLTKNSGDYNIDISVGIYDSSLRKFVVDGIDQTIKIPKNADYQWQWGSTISLRCKPNPGDFILNDNGGLIIYFSENRKITALVSPHSHTFRNYTSILIDSSNNITSIGGGSNHALGLIKIDLEGNILGLKRDEYGRGFSGIYAYGKIVEDDEYQYIGTTRGYCKSPNFLESDDTIQINNASYINSYMGDMDVDASYAYVTGRYYDNNAYKSLLADYTNLTTFGVGEESSGLDGLNKPFSISVGTNYVFISDTYNERIMVLDKEEFTYVTHLGITGNAGSDPSLFSGPGGSFVKNGRLYIGDRLNDRIKIYDELTLEYIKSIELDIRPRYISVNDEYIAVLDENTSANLKVIRISDSSIVLEKTMISASNGPGRFNRYGAKGARRYDSSIYTLDRGNGLIDIDMSTLTFSDRVTYTGGDIYDVAIDVSYYYVCLYNTPGIRKINRNSRTVVEESLTEGSGDGEWGSGYPRSCAIDSSYMYVTDTTNNRIQIVNKSDLSYVTKFGTLGNEDDGTNFNNPYGVEISGDYLYVGDYGNYKLRVYNKNTLEHLGSYSILKPFRIRTYEDELFVIDYSKNLRVYDISTFELKRSKNYPQGYLLGQTDTTYTLEIMGNKILILDQYRASIVDKETLEIETSFGPWYTSALVDSVIDEENILIDVVFTDDYKLKVYANGLSSLEVDLDSEYEYNITSKSILGNFRTNYSNVEYDWFAFYNREKTLEEHINDYRNLKSRN